jgi:hypothetical protein
VASGAAHFEHDGQRQSHQDYRMLQYPTERKRGRPLPKTHSKSKPLLSFRHKVDIEVGLLEFQPLESVKFLDYRRYEKGKHRVEIGFVEGGCDRKLVRAIVTHGMVTGFDVEPCAESKFVPGGMKAILEEVRKRVSAKAHPWRPIPISDLAKVPARELLESVGCFRVCETNGAFCYICCFGLFGFRCSLESIFDGPLRNR